MTAEQAILNAIAFLKTQPDCKTACELLAKKLATEKLMNEVYNDGISMALSWPVSER